ncbi:MAG: hypothetical protein ABJF50_06875 [Paracoccaceae bacterium]
MTLTKLVSLTSALALMSACGISEKQLSEFGRTADRTVQVVGMASTVTSNLIVQNEVTLNACEYLKGRSYTLASVPKTELSPLLSDQKAVVAALGAYVDAIAGALDAEEQANVDEAGGSLATSVGALGEQVDPSAQTGPSVSLLLNAIVQIEKNRRISAVKAEMEKVIEYLERLQVLLKEDERRALAEMDLQITQWEQHTRCVLNASRDSPNAEATFREADQAKRALATQRNQAGLAVTAMDALIEAHYKIVFGEGDFEEGLKTLDTFLAGLQAIKDA